MMIAVAARVTVQEMCLCVLDAYMHEWDAVSSLTAWNMGQV